MSSALPKDLASLDSSVLEDLVRHHNRLYWDDNAPELSDTDFDLLVRRLRELAPDAKALDELGPTAGAEGERYGNPVTHERPMLSLDKCYGDDDLMAWAATFEGDVLVTPKFDGIAASLRFDERGELSLASTRGDGVVGDDITANVRGVKDIPRRAVQGVPIEVRGEVFMRLSIFAGYKDRFLNPRNLTAGAIKQKDPKKSAAYGLSFAAYELFGTELATEKEKLARLKELGFSPIECDVVAKDKVVEAYRDLAARRSSLDFEIDGVVMKADRVSEQRRLGATSHHPRYAIAYKFQGDSGTSKLREVEWSVARTGAITPVAIIDPVMLSGAMVSRASLHHPGYIAKLGITRNAEVRVTRRGGVIPNVEEVITPGDEEIAIPTACPSPHQDPDDPRTVHADGDFLYCDHPEKCRAARLGTIGHFVAATGIDGFGDRIVGELYDRKLVLDAADLYALKLDDLLPIDRVGEKLAKKLLESVSAHRTLPLETFLRALGIAELGKHVSKILATEFGTIGRVRAVTAEELAAIHTIGEVIAKHVTEGLLAHASRIDALLAHVTVEEGAPAEERSGPFAGQSFVFTGKMATLDRKSAQAKVIALGGTAPDSVNKTTTFLVVGDDKSDGKKSTKEKTADKLLKDGATLRIISETEFLTMSAGLSAP